MEFLRRTAGADRGLAVCVQVKNANDAGVQVRVFAFVLRIHRHIWMTVGVDHVLLPTHVVRVVVDTEDLVLEEAVVHDAHRRDLLVRGRTRLERCLAWQTPEQMDFEEVCEVLRICFRQ